jgi:hypothetical protein
MHYQGVMHQFFGMSAVVDKAKSAWRLATGQLTQAFSK